MSFVNHPTHTTLVLTKELALKVTEQSNDLVNWPKEMRLKGQASTKINRL